MIKKQTVLIFTFVTILKIFSFGQATLQPGILKDDPRESVPEKMVGQDGNYFYLLKSNTEGKGISFFIEKYSCQNYGLQYSKAISNSENTEDRFIDAVFLSGKIMVFRSHFEKNEQEVYTVYVQVISEEGEILIEQKQLMKISVPKIKTGLDVAGVEVKEFMRYDLRYDISVSENGQYALVAAIVNEMTTTATRFKKCLVSVLDGEKVSVFSENILPDHFKNFEIAPWNFKLDSKGNPLFLFNYLNDQKKRQTAIGILNAKSNIINGMDVQLDREGNALEDIDYIIRGDEAYCSAIYKNRVREKDNMDLTALFGVFSQVFNFASLKSGKPDSLHFSPEIIHLLQPPNHLKGRGYKICSINVTEGNIYTVIEQFNDAALVVFNMNTKGKISWLKAIPKLFAVTSYVDKDFFHVIAQNGLLRLIYCEHPSNTEKLTQGELSMNKYRFTNYRKSNVISLTANPSGNLNKEVIFKNDNTNLIFIDGKTNLLYTNSFPVCNNIIVPLSDGSFIVYFTNNHQYAFGRLSYK
ncbi:MAG: hypothetical protein JWO09_2068 [Bacteroidetes bacterium]|nr:hypothetical protein [Bacteroidota bacterium]